MNNYGDGVLETHPGRVEEIKGNTAYIKIFPKSACSSCSVSGGCSALNGKSSKILQVRCDKSLSLGQSVQVGVSQATGILSILLSFVTPVILMLASVFILLELGCSEGQAALIACVVFGLYLLLLFLLKKPMERKLKIHILPSEST